MAVAAWSLIVALMLSLIGFSAKLQPNSSVLVARADQLIANHDGQDCMVAVDGIERLAKCAAVKDKYVFVFTGDNFRVFAYPLTEKSRLLASRIDGETKIKDRSVADYFAFEPIAGI